MGARMIEVNPIDVARPIAANFFNMAGILVAVGWWARDDPSPPSSFLENRPLFTFVGDGLG